MSKFFSSYTKTVRLMLKEYNNELYNYFYDDNIEEVWERFDNWDGGIDYYSIIVRIPVVFFVSLRQKNKIPETEELILGLYNDVMRGSEEAKQLDKIILKPSTEEISIIGDDVDDSMWKPGLFRLFISHLTENKESASNLKKCLLMYGIDGFVAHEDIQPSKEWQLELEKALFTMDALCAIVVPKFIESQWCDQEVGIALGQRKLVISINKGRNPYGFFGKYQASQSNSKDANVVAKNVWLTIITNEKTKLIYFKKLIEVILNTTNESDALQYIKVLENCKGISKQYIEKLRDNWNHNFFLFTSQELVDSINPVFEKYGLTKLGGEESKNEKQIDYDELPF